MNVLEDYREIDGAFREEFFNGPLRDERHGRYPKPGKKAEITLEAATKIEIAKAIARGILLLNSDPELENAIEDLTDLMCWGSDKYVYPENQDHGHLLSLIVTDDVLEKVRELEERYKIPLKVELIIKKRAPYVVSYSAADDTSPRYQPGKERTSKKETRPIREYCLDEPTRIEFAKRTVRNMLKVRNCRELSRSWFELLDLGVNVAANMVQAMQERYSAQLVLIQQEGEKRYSLMSEVR
ncbi:hypothetical protein J4410_00170 [Candidatus Woesearchaeota archaeon]|nr:hypothetical protein [Candidatus Woesearchaeota archaeon]